MTQNLSKNEEDKLRKVLVDKRQILNQVNHNKL